MDIKLQQSIRDFGEVADDTADAYIAYLKERETEKKKVYYLIYEKLKKRRSDAIKKMNDLIQEAYGK